MKMDPGVTLQVCKKIENRLYSCGSACGAILGGVSDDEIEKLRSYGLYIELIHDIMLPEIGLRRVKELLNMVTVVA
ncbi:hypothetical protein GIB67_011544 [Kingdonia uniflora]|uniref:Uncharacterized protein n=1 Tax=Kingdonia uniflora TaxID=39325 RepID=A0A7J7NLT9_9MAGN|nr:hypothetical protein GIB67_011544 [Kingdonia uniflora]